LSPRAGEVLRIAIVVAKLESMRRRSQPSVMHQVVI
jgi:hypothetical protein